MNQLQSMTIYDIIYQGVSHTNEDTCILTFVLFGKREFYEQVNIYETKIYGGVFGAMLSTKW